MGFRDFFFKGRGLGVDELARRLDVPEKDLRAVQPRYREFALRKRSGGERRIAEPDRELKRIQRRILYRLLTRLKAHPNVTGFEKGHSIVTNALPHAGQAVVVRMDLKDFFGSTKADRIDQYFRRIGWNNQAAGLLTELCTHKGGLPQGAPTSPRLSNLVNYRLDAQLAGLADKLGATYTRYADDLTFSLPEDNRTAIHTIIRFTKAVAREHGYELHQRRKLHIRRRHDRQTVTGLVVNDRVNLPRATRRLLRAVEHRLAARGSCTLERDQLAGWRAFQSMVAKQASH
jgi:retron-type reverse transcriptase